MPRNCLLNRLPVELLYNLFNYFLAHENFFSFCDISDYINNVLQSYSTYQLDFKSIRKVDFDFVCHRINPKQVITLTLSDDSDTPGQSELFLSHFRIEQFTQLRSLTLIKTEITSLKSIFPTLIKLERLLSFEDVKMRYQYENQIDIIILLLSDIYARIIPQLNRLHLNNSVGLKSISLSHLHHRKLTKCSLDEFETISLNVSQLQSLDICLDVNSMNLEPIALPNQLNRLCLKIDNSKISMSQMEQLLIKLFHLKHFKIQMSSTVDIADGYRWQMSIEHLITFNFKFNIKLLPIESTLNSFRTSFWLDEKHWLVAYQNECLFSVPYFSPIHTSIPYQLPICSTTSYYKLIYDHITKLTIAIVPNNNYIYFNQIKILDLRCSISFDALLSTLDLKQVEH